MKNIQPWLDSQKLPVHCPGYVRGVICSYLLVPFVETKSEEIFLGIILQVFACNN